CRASSKPEPSGKPISRITKSQTPSFSFFSALCLVSTHATSYFSRSKRSCKVAPSERSSSTSNRRFIVGLHAIRMLCSGDSRTVRQIKLRDETRFGATLERNGAAHPLHQLAHDVKAYSAPAAAAVAH